MENTYFVSFKLFNGENKGWAYKIELKTTDLAEAERKYGELIKTYYGLAPFIFGCIRVEDMFGNEIENKYWSTTPEEV